MQRKIFRVSRAAALTCCLACLLLGSTAWAVIWDRVLYDGGVVNDLCANTETTDKFVFASCMANGLFTVRWNGSGGAWGYPWKEHLAGRGSYGTDAKVFNSTLYALSAAEATGMHVGAHAGNDVWTWTAYTACPYPSPPMLPVDIHWEDGIFYDASDHFFGAHMQISSTGGSDIFRWETTPPPAHWADATGAAEVNVGKFHRDVNDASTLYGVGESGIWQCGATYTSNWTDITDSFEGVGYTIEAVTGFYQYPDGTIYILAACSDDRMRVCTQYNNGTCIAEWEPADDNCDIIAEFNHSAGGLIVRDFTTEPYKEIWIGTNEYGVLYLNTQNGTQSDDWEQMLDPGNEFVGGWNYRSLLRDPMITGNMAFFYGVWQAGLYHCVAAGNPDVWTHPIEGLCGGVAAPSLIGGYLNPTTEELYSVGFQRGLRRLDVSTTIPVYSPIGEENTLVDERAAYAKSFNDIAQGPDFNGSVYFAGARPYVQYDFPDGSSSDFNFGGLYSIDPDANDECAGVTGWDGDGDVADWQWDVNRIVADPNANPPSLYVATGEVGANMNYLDPTNMNYHMVRVGYMSGVNLTWNTVIEFSPTISMVRAPLAMAVYPLAGHQNQVVVVGLGNAWNYELQGADPNTLGRVYGPIPTSNYNVVSEATRLAENTNLHSVFDIATTARLETPGDANDYVAWIATAGYISNGGVQGHFGDGGLYKIEVGNGTGYQTAEERSPVTGQDRAYPCVEYMTYGTRRILATISVGLNASNQYEKVFWLGQLDGLDDVRWKSYGLFQIQDENNVNVDAGGAEIYPLIEQGNRVRIFVGGYNTLVKDFLATTHEFSGQRWYWISNNHYPTFDSLSVLMAPCDSLEEIRDQFGNRYRPANPTVDSIYVWNPLKAYGIRTTGADEFECFGDSIPADTTLTLLPAPQDSSWVYNYIAYLPTDTLTASDAFLADSDYVIIVKNDDGQFWRPIDGTPGFNMVPGEGYQVGVSDTLEYQYPISQGQNSIGPGGPGTKGNPANQIASLEPSHFQFTAYTGDYYPIYIAELLVNGNPPEVGDEVAVFAPGNLCVGAGVYDGTFPLKVPAWKDDPTTEAADGYTSGQTLSFKFFDASANVETPLEMSVTVQNMEPGAGQAFTKFEQGFYAQHYLHGSYVLPGVYYLAQNYPNPFNPTTTIRYDLPFNSNVKLEVFDIQGRIVTTLVDGKLSAGFRTVHWDGANRQGAEIASGVYFYRLKADATQTGLGKKGKYEKTHKMVMLK
jgi:hypothetical protein